MGDGRIMTDSEYNNWYSSLTEKEKQIEICRVLEQAQLKVKFLKR